MWTTATIPVLHSSNLVVVIMLLRTRSLLMGWTTVLYLLLLVLLTVEGSTGTANQSLRQNETSSTTTSQHRTLQRVSVGSIISLVLFNTEKNVPIQVLLPNVVVNLQSAAVAASTLTIQAMVRRASTTEIGIDYVQFGLDQNNNNARKEYNAPYALCGDQRNLFLPCRTLTVGSHTVSATPYFAGKAGTTLNVTFRIVDTPPSTKSCKIPRVRIYLSNQRSIYRYYITCIVLPVVSNIALTIAY